MVNKLRLNLELNNGLKDLFKLYCQHYKDLKKFKYFTDKTLINFAFMDLIIIFFPMLNLFIVQEILGKYYWNI